MQRMGRDFERPDPLTDAVRHLIDWKTIRRDGVPQAQKADDRYVAPRRCPRLRGLVPAQPLLDLLDDEAPVRMEMLLVIVPVRSPRQPVELGFRDVPGRNEPLIDDQADHHPDGEGAAAETESVDFVTGCAKIATRKLVERNHV